MRRIKILAKALTEAELAAAIGLAKESGCSAAELETVTTIGDPVENCDDEIVLVVMTPATCADTALEEELANTPNGGRRAICIWPGDGNIPAEHPPAAKKYGYSIIPWDADKLRAVAADDDVFYFETAGGEALPPVDTERNLCVVEVKPAEQRAEAS